MSKPSIKVPYTEPSISSKEVEFALDAVQNGWGPKCYEYLHRFEAAFAEYCGTKYAVATSSCTGAIHLGLAGLGIGSGDEVILADINWVATVAPITYLNAQPVLIDVQKDSWCIDPKRIEEAITPKTKAIIATHLYGNVCALDELLEIGNRHGIPVIEDAAEAIGSLYHGKQVGGFGQFGVFSFHGTKTITTGEGGMLVTNDEALYERILTLSNHGRSRTQTKQFWPDLIGYKYKMSNIEAAIGLAQLDRIDELVAGKLRIFDAYRLQLGKLEADWNQAKSDIVRPGYWMTTMILRSPGFQKETREALIQHLKTAGIDARIFFWPLSMTDHFERRHEAPVADELYWRGLNLPSASSLSDEQIDHVCAAVTQFFK